MKSDCPYCSLFRVQMSEAYFKLLYNLFCGKIAIAVIEFRNAAGMTDEVLIFIFSNLPELNPDSYLKIVPIYLLVIDSFKEKVEVSSFEQDAI